MYWTMRSGGSTGDAAAEPQPSKSFAQRAGGSVTNGKKSKKNNDPPPGKAIAERIGGRRIDGEQEPEFNPQTGPPITNRAGGSIRRSSHG